MSIMAKLGGLIGVPEDRKNLALTYWVTLGLGPVPLLSAYFTGANIAVFAALCGVFLMSSIAAIRLGGRLAPFILSAALVGQAISFTMAFSGHPWQLDTHMMFFVILAVVATQFSILSLLMTTVLIAVHHLSFSVMLPSLVYPSVDLMQNLSRTVLHAVIVLIETAVLAGSILGRNRIAAAQEEEAARVVAAQKVAQEAQQEAQSAFDKSSAVVATMSERLKSLASKDLDCEIRDELHADFDGLRSDFNQVVLNLRSVLSDASDSSKDFKASSSELSMAANDLARRSEHQANTLSKSTEEISELAVSLNVVVKDAKTASEMTKRASTGAGEGGDIVSAAVRAMDQIQSSSSEISKIIQVIDDIAFQTNMLALNAAVEAARAGESGLGFAVVAGEVRSLAQSTASAASQVNKLINASAEHVTEGARLVTETGASLDDIVSRSNDADRLVASIYNEMGKQAETLGKIRSEVHAIDQNTQENAAVVEEMTAMSESMAEGARLLARSLEGFNLTCVSGQDTSSDHPEKNDKRCAA